MFEIALGVGSGFALGSMPNEVSEFWVVVGDAVIVSMMIGRRE